jgi:hypothetical protein
MEAADLDNVMSIEGALTAAEAKLLYSAAECVRDGCIVEIGSWRGRSTAALAYGSRAGYGVPVYAVDPHERFRDVLGGEYTGSDDRAAFMANMLRLCLTDIVRLVNLSSEHIASWPDAVGLLWVDGDHRYMGVKRDLKVWLPYLRPDATIAFHDSTNPRIGPFHAIAELIASSQWERQDAVDKAVILRRKPPL